MDLLHIVKIAVPLTCGLRTFGISSMGVLVSADMLVARICDV